jgi:hypothetical protein
VYYLQGRIMSGVAAHGTLNLSHKEFDRVAYRMLIPIWLKRDFGTKISSNHRFSPRVGESGSNKSAGED